MTARLIQHHDEFAKTILDQPGNADAFLRERLPAAVVTRLSDKPAIDRSESHISPEVRNLRGDRVYALETTDGDEVLVWTLVEHKAWPESDTLLRLLGDLTGIARKGARKRRNRDGTVWLVPAPIFVLVLYHGVRRWPLPTDLAQSYGLPKDITDLGLLSFLYRVIDLLRIPDDALSSRPSLRAALMVLKYALYDDDATITLDRLIAAAAAFDLTTLIVVVRYLVKETDWLEVNDIRTRVARLMPGQEEKVMSPALKQIIDEERPRIIDEERPKIIDEVGPGFVAQGRVQTLLQLLERKFGPLSPATIERVRTAEPRELDQMTDAILDAHRLEDVLAPPPIQ